MGQGFLLEQDGQLDLTTQMVVASTSSLSTKLVSTDVRHPEMRDQVYAASLALK